LTTHSLEGRRERFNTAANYIGKLWGGLSNFVFVPLYIKAVGVEGYGIIALQAVLLVLIHVVDGGLSTAFARYVSTAGSRSEIAPMLSSLERVYASAMFVLAAVATAVVFTFDVADRLPAGTFAPVSNACGVSLMIFGAALQVCMSVYSGFFLGSRLHVHVNAFQIGFTAIRSGVVLIPLFVTGSLLVYFIWQVFVVLAFLGLMRNIAWRTLGERPVLQDFKVGDCIKKILPAVCSVLVISVASALNQQLDRMVVTAIAGVTGLGAYTVAALIGSLPLLIATPYAVTIAPRLHRDAANGLSSAAATIFVRDSFRVAGIAGAMTVLILTIPLYWYRLVSPAAERDEVWESVVALLAAGNFALALQLVPYQLCIARLNLRANTITAVVALVFTAPLSYWAGSQFGEIGVAATWLFANAAMLIFLGWRVFCLSGSATFRMWMERAAVVPCICIGVGVAIAFVVRSVGGDSFPSEIVAAVGSLFYIAIMVLVYRHCVRSETGSVGHRPSR
jgi:O-antigen/teichoic acid export membrane protein